MSPTGGQASSETSGPVGELIDRVRALELLAELVAARSPNPPGDEREVAGVVGTALASLGLPPAVVLGKDPRRPNLLVRIGDRGPRLMLVGHMDTMPPGNLSSWESDPFILDNRDGRLFGLGSADMKSGIAVALVAAAAIVDDPGWDGALDLLFVADEENCSEYGVKWLVDQEVLRADVAIILEPSGNGDRSWDRLFVTQRGSCVLRLVANGIPGHSAGLVPAGDRAGVALARAMVALADSDLFAGRTHQVDGTPPTVNIGTMLEGGFTPFMHPETLSATVEVRTIEGMTETEVHQEIAAVIDRAGLSSRIGLRAAEAPLDWVPPGGAASDDRMMAAVEKAWKSTLATNAQHAVLLGVTDSCWLSAAGIPTLPALGCGSLAVAHRPNEWVSEADLYTALDLTEAVLRNYYSD